MYISSSFQKEENMSKKKYQVDTHHRKPRSIGGVDHYPNTVSVRRSHHRAWHIVFGNMSAQKIVAYLNAKWIDPDYEVVLVKKGEP